MDGSEVDGTDGFEALISVDCSGRCLGVLVLW